jgi:hypothetical protein
MSEIKVPVKDSEGNESLEPLQEKQSDGSMWILPKNVGGENHEHYFTVEPGSRIAKCTCGVAGHVFPHTTVIKDGHIYDLNGVKKI